MSAVDTRNISRDSLFLLATLRVDGTNMECKVRVRNLSSGGMMTETELRIGRGSRVAVELRNIGWVNGTVAWVQDKRCGIAFDEEIDPKRARASLNSPDETSAARIVRPFALSASRFEDPSRLRKI